MTSVNLSALNHIGFVPQRVKEYLVGSSLVCKLQAKHDQLKVAVEKGITSAFFTEQLLTHRAFLVHRLVLSFTTLFPFGWRVKK